MTSAAAGAIPRDTDVVSELEMNEELGGGELVLSTNNDAVIKAVNMYGEGVFEEEARFVYFPNPKTTARGFIRPPRDICADVSIKVLVSARMSSVYHVFELEFTLPKFCMYARLNAPVATPSGSVSFRLPGVNARRMATWIDDAFNTNVTDIVQGPDDDFECGFVRCVLYTGPHTNPLARSTPILKDFARRVSLPTPRFQSRHTSAPFNSN